MLFCSCIFFSPFSIAITSLWEEGANLGAFCALVRFALILFYQFSLPLCVWDGLRLVVDRIYPTELQLNRANSSNTEVSFLDLILCISNGTVSTKIHDKRDDFDFDIVNFPFLDGDVPRRTSYGVYIYLNLLDSPELLQILMTSTIVIKPLLPNFLGRAIVTF